MKKKIIALGKAHGIDLRVEVEHEAFDIYNYDVYIEHEFIGVYVYWTGKTSTGVTYPVHSFLPELEEDIKKYKNKKCIAE